MKYQSQPIRQTAKVLIALCMTIGMLPDVAKARANAIVILVDDLGYADLGCHGSEDIITPHIDKLAAEGVRCTAGYVSAPQCSPSRAGLLTGRFQSRYGFETNPEGEKERQQGGGLPTSERTIGDHLRGHGYRTAAIGKWHLGMHPAHHPQSMGFDEYFGFLQGSFEYLPKDLEQPFARYYVDPEQVGLLRGREPARVKEPQYLTDLLTDEAIRFIERRGDTPFFLYLAYNAPHTPMEATKEKLEMFSHIQDPLRRTFAAMMSSLDDGVGRIMQVLEDEGIAEETIVFFISDNGGPTNRNSSLNLPFFGEKGFLYEGGIRVPFIVNWKSRLPAGMVYSYPVSALDVLPTVVAAARGELPADTIFDGVNLIPFFTGENQGNPHPLLMWRYGASAAVLLNGHKKFLTLWQEGPVEFYDLERSVVETMDHCLKDVDTSTYETLFHNWNKELEKPLWSPYQWTGRIQRERAGLPAKGVFDPVTHGEEQ